MGSGGGGLLTCDSKPARLGNDGKEINMEKQNFNFTITFCSYNSITKMIACSYPLG